MSKAKTRKQLKKQKRQQRKSEFGFTRTKQIVEIKGSEEGYFLDSSPFLEKQHEQVEEVLVLNKDNNTLASDKPRFNQLSTVSVNRLVQPDLSAMTSDQEQDSLGFFFDSTPAMPQKEERKNKKKEQKRKIIKDDSVFIALTDEEEEEEEDDNISISSSEDIEIIKSLAHWGKQDDMNQLEVDSFKKRRRRSLDAMDYHLLESMHITDILEQEKDQYDDDDLLLTEELDFEQELEHVPTGLIQSYKGLIREEKYRYNIERRYVQKRKEKANMTDPSSTILQQIIHEFIDKQDVESYEFRNLTSHGRHIIIPKIAKLFQLKTTELDTNFVKLEKTVNTCIPSSFKTYINQKNVVKKKVKVSKKKVNQEVVHHGKQVAVDSAPISSNNIGHRMLSAMGWKEGDTIGNNEDGIKEPIKVFMRANRRGLGA